MIYSIILVLANSIQQSESINEDAVLYDDGEEVLYDDGTNVEYETT